MNTGTLVRSLFAKRVSLARRSSLIRWPNVASLSVLARRPPRLSSITTTTTAPLVTSIRTFSTEDPAIVGHDLLIDGLKIHYDKCGEGSQVLLLMPGGLGSGRIDFPNQLDGLDRKKFTMIAWDPPGYGLSRPPDRDFTDSYRRDATIAAKLMQKLNYQRYSILGWSDGGMTGMILAAANPKSVRKLIIWGSNSYVCDEDREQLLKLRDARTALSHRFRDKYIGVYGEEYFYRLWDQMVAHYITLNDICKGDLEKIECPVLILHGDHDPLVAREHPVYLVNHLPNATLFRFAEGKHNIHQTYAQEFNKLVEDFLAT